MIKSLLNGEISSEKIASVIMVIFYALLSVGLCVEALL